MGGRVEPEAPWRGPTAHAAAAGAVQPRGGHGAFRRPQAEARSVTPRCVDSATLSSRGRVVGTAERSGVGAGSDAGPIGARAHPADRHPAGTRRSPYCGAAAMPGHQRAAAAADAHAAGCRSHPADLCGAGHDEGRGHGACGAARPGAQGGAPAQLQHLRCRRRRLQGAWRRRGPDSDRAR